MIDFSSTRQTHRYKGRPDELGMSDIEASYLEDLYNKTDVVFEWGSGWSTLYFKDFVRKYYSVEHDKSWYNLISNEIWKSSDENTELYFKSPHEIKFEKQYDDVAKIILKEWSEESISRPPSKFEVESYEEDGKWYYKGRSGLDWHCFIDYLNVIETTNEKRFDVIMVDGRVRPFCAFKAKDYMDEKSILLMHDFTVRPWNHSILEWFELEKTVDTIGVLRKK